MIRRWIACAVALNAVVAFARSAPAEPFRVGDTATYAYVRADGVPSDSIMVYTVTSIADEGVWLSMDYSLVAGPQGYRFLIDPATKRLKRVLHRGIQQPFSDPNAAPAEQGPESTISVPAGDFRCSDRKVVWPNGSADHYWIDSSGAVPIFGYVRILYGLPGGSGVRLDLVSFRRG